MLLPSSGNDAWHIELVAVPARTMTGTVCYGSDRDDWQRNDRGPPPRWLTDPWPIFEG